MLFVDGLPVAFKFGSCALLGVADIAAPHDRAERIAHQGNDRRPYGGNTLIGQLNAATVPARTRQQPRHRLQCAPELDVPVTLFLLCLLLCPWLSPASIRSLTPLLENRHCATREVEPRDQDGHSDRSGVSI